MIKGYEGAVAVKENHPVFVGRGRGRGIIAAVIAIDAISGFMVPQNLPALAIDAHRMERLVLTVGGGDENFVSEHNGRRSAWAGHIQCPNGGLLSELARESFFFGVAVEIRSSPLRPICGDRGDEARSSGEQCQNVRGMFAVVHAYSKTLLVFRRN